MLLITNFDEPDSIVEVGAITESCGQDYVHTEKGGPYMKAFLFPDSSKEELLQILNKRKELKKAYDDSMKLVYELKNKIMRGEYK